jgi:hypothetical protein
MTLIASNVRMPIPQTHKVAGVPKRNLISASWPTPNRITGESERAESERTVSLFQVSVPDLSAEFVSRRISVPVQVESERRITVTNLIAEYECPNSVAGPHLEVPNLDGLVSFPVPNLIPNLIVGSDALPNLNAVSVSLGCRISVPGIVRISVPNTDLPCRITEDYLSVRISSSNFNAES